MQRLNTARQKIRALREEYWKDVLYPGQWTITIRSWKKRPGVADFMELGELMIVDALNRNESCGGHFREEYQTPEEKPFAMMPTTPMCLSGIGRGCGSRSCTRKN